MATPSGDPDKLDLDQLRKFLDNFLHNHRDDNFLAIKHGNYTVTGRDQIIGETIDWTIQYLQYMSCPSSLEASLTKAVVDETQSKLANGDLIGGSASNVNCDQIDAQGNAPPKNVFKSMNLLQNVTSTVNEVCKRLKSSNNLSNGSAELVKGRVVPSAVSAVKNGRRKMEDRHVVLHDLNHIYGDVLPNISSEPQLSFYGVYDGHAGKDAAAFAASHVHGKILSSKYYPQDPINAIKDAFNQTDEIFLEKGKEENLQSGTTAVCTFIRDKTIYTAWLGDSQATLIRNGKPVKITDPHKPNRDDERKRIEGLGGCVLHWGTWRVNGQLAVSRAIGDCDYKPWVSCDPDVTTIEMDGTEDLLIIACDGLWDTVTPEQATNQIFQSLKTYKDDLNQVSNKLVTLAKNNGSNDNISIIVVFLRPIEDIINLYGKEESEENIEELTEPLELSELELKASFSGITSTSTFVGPDQIMNGTEDSVDLQPSPAEESGSEKPMFDSPGGGGMVFGDSSDPFNTGDVAAAGDISFGEQFKQVSPSMFEQSLNSSQGCDELQEAKARGGSSEEVDFMANQEQNWIQQQSSSIGSLKGDSGFISPAVGPSSEQASHSPSEESSENAAKATGDFKEPVDVPEAEENPFASISGGQLPTDLMDLARKVTPNSSSDEEEDSTPLEDILAQARNQPEREKPEAVVGLEEDSDDSENDTSPPSSLPPQVKAPELPPSQAQAAPDDSSEDEGEVEGFTFVSNMHKTEGELGNKEEVAENEANERNDEAEAIPESSFENKASSFETEVLEAAEDANAGEDMQTVDMLADPCTPDIHAVSSTQSQLNTFEKPANPSLDNLMEPSLEEDKENSKEPLESSELEHQATNSDIVFTSTSVEADQVRNASCHESADMQPSTEDNSESNIPEFDSLGRAQMVIVDGSNSLSKGDVVQDDDIPLEPQETKAKEECNKDASDIVKESPEVSTRTNELLGAEETLPVSTSGGQFSTDLMDLAGKVTPDSSSDEKRDFTAVEGSLTQVHDRPGEEKAEREFDQEEDSDCSENDSNPPSSLPPEIEAPELPEASQSKEMFEDNASEDKGGMKVPNDNTQNTENENNEEMGEEGGNDEEAVHQQELEAKLTNTETDIEENVELNVKKDEQTVVLLEDTSTPDSNAIPTTLLQSNTSEKSSNPSQDSLIEPQELEKKDGTSEERTIVELEIEEKEVVERQIESVEDVLSSVKQEINSENVTDEAKSSQSPTDLQSDVIQNDVSEDEGEIKGLTSAVSNTDNSEVENEIEEEVCEKAITDAEVTLQPKFEIELTNTKTEVEEVVEQPYVEKEEQIVEETTTPSISVIPATPSLSDTSKESANLSLDTSFVEPPIKEEEVESVKDTSDEPSDLPNNEDPREEKPQAMEEVKTSDLIPSHNKEIPLEMETDEAALTKILGALGGPSEPQKAEDPVHEESKSKTEEQKKIEGPKKILKPADKKEMSKKPAGPTKSATTSRVGARPTKPVSGSAQPAASRKPAPVGTKRFADSKPSSVMNSKPTGPSTRLTGTRSTTSTSTRPTSATTRPTSATARPTSASTITKPLTTTARLSKTKPATTFASSTSTRPSATRPTSTRPTSATTTKPSTGTKTSTQRSTTVTSRATGSAVANPKKPTEVKPTSANPAASRLTTRTTASSRPGSSGSSNASSARLSSKSVPIASRTTKTSAPSPSTKPGITRPSSGTTRPATTKAPGSIRPAANATGAPVNRVAAARAAAMSNRGPTKKPVNGVAKKGVPKKPEVKEGDKAKEGSKPMEVNGDHNEQSQQPSEVAATANPPYTESAL